MLTLQELKQVVSNREERRKVPSAKYLRENDVAVAKQRLMDCAEIIAYQTGYVLYCVGDYATVFPLFTCRDYVYEAERKIAVVEEKFFDDQPWYVRLILEGEDRLWRNRETREHDNCISYSCISEEWCELADKGQCLLERIIAVISYDFILGANILVATKKDFEPANRKRFCSRIATGDYDAVIIGHTQFEKIPLSKERQIAMLEDQIADITFSIEEAAHQAGQNYTIKQLEKTKKSLQARMKKLNDQTRKDDVVTFEQLGVDRLFVDESHSFKNLFLYTKMRNVAGISQTDAQKSSDMFMKCRYMDELTGGRGITFATGTPVSNSMTELYTIMRYLQYDTLMRMGMGHFDSWAATFGETVTAIELSPEGYALIGR